MKTSSRQYTVATILGCGVKTASQIVPQFKKHFPIEEARRFYFSTYSYPGGNLRARKTSVIEEQIEIGYHGMVTEALRGLYRKGWAKRVTKAIWMKRPGTWTLTNKGKKFYKVGKYANKNSG